MKIVRFFYVHAPKAKKLHRLVGPRVEGSRTVCGQYVHLGWVWARIRPGVKRTMERCKLCQKRADATISVERVRDVR